MTEVRVEPTAPQRLTDIAATVQAPSVAGRGSNPVVLIASTCAWPSVPKLAIALARASCEVVSVAPAQHPLNLTLAVSRRLRYRATRPLQSLTEAIALTRPDLIVPCDERAVEHLHRLYARSADAGIRDLIARSLGRPDSHAAASSRQALMALAGEHGVLTPATLAVDSLADLRAWAEPLPWVLKADGSWGGLGVRIVSTLAQAEAAYRELSRSIRPLFALRRFLLARDPFWLTPWLHSPPRRITVQRYVEGRPANCVIAAWNGEALGGIAVEVVASDGETGPASIVRLTQDSRMLAGAGRIVQVLGLSGMVGFDFVVETATGRPFLLEMNPRATPICHLRLGAGRDPVGELVARASGLPPPIHPAETACDTIALFPQADLQFGGQAILASAYRDTPFQEPQLVKAAMRRWIRKKAAATFGSSTPE